MAKEPHTPEGIYIHLPFCRSKCAYCAFLSRPYPEEIKEKYITALVSEMRGQREVCQFETENQAELKVRDAMLSSPVRSVYFGGGTPSELTGRQIKRIVRAVRESFNIEADAEWTIEMNPASESRQWLEEVREAGFNRLSLGVQSLNDRTLQIIGRKHSAADAVRSVEDAKEAGFENISVDLMYGLHGQSIEDIGHFIRTFSAYSEVKHFSCYSLQIEEGTRMQLEVDQGKVSLPDEKTEREMDAEVKKCLQERGFLQYEISNFAKPGFESVHNSSYWKMKGYWAFGAGASFFGNMVRGTHTENIAQYISDPLHSLRDVHALTREEAMGDMMFTGLRRMKGVSDRDFQELFGESLFEKYKDAVDTLKGRGLIERQGDCIFLTPLGQNLANQVFIEFV